jgi:putative oxidoreductase
VSASDIALGTHQRIATLILISLGLYLRQRVRKSRTRNSSSVPGRAYAISVSWRPSAISFWDQVLPCVNPGAGGQIDEGFVLSGAFDPRGAFSCTAASITLSKEGLAQYAGAKNVPRPDVAVLASGAMLVAGGASLILGLKPKVGILPLIGFLAVVSPKIHDFWNERDPQAHQQQFTQFAKNVGLAGAVLALMGVEKWPISIAGS